MKVAQSKYQTKVFLIINGKYTFNLLQTNAWMYAHGNCNKLNKKSGSPLIMSPLINIDINVNMSNGQSLLTLSIDLIKVPS